MITIKTAYKYAMLRALTGSLGAVVKTASGVIASFNSNTEAAITKGVFDIDYDSKGVSSMDITRCGKNLFNIEGETLGAYLLSDGTIRNDSTAVSWNLSDYIPVKEGETYYFNPNTTAGSSAKHGYYDTSKGFVSSINSGASSFTVPSGVSFMRFSYRNTSTDIQLELGSTPSTYEAYQGTTYPVSFGTTIYGGCFDSVTGELYSTLDSDGTPLETPVKTELTPIPITTFKGDNNIFCDTGDSDIEYLAKAASKKDRILSYLPLIYGRKELL